MNRPQRTRSQKQNYRYFQMCNNHFILCFQFYLELRETRLNQIRKERFEVENGYETRSHQALSLNEE